MIRLDLLIKKKKKRRREKKKNNITSCPNASLGGDEWGQSYYSFELLRCGGKTADIQSSMTFGVCYFSFTFFNSWAGDLWLDKCLELFFFFFFFCSNGDHLNTPHRQRELFFLSLSLPLFLPPPSSSVHLFLSVSLCLLWSFFVFFLFLIFFLSRFSPAFCLIVDIIHLSIRIYCTSTGVVNAIQPAIFRKYMTRPLKWCSWAHVFSLVETPSIMSREKCK